MKPIYFPFTYIPESVGKALAACFGQTAVYQISAAKIPDDMQNLVKYGVLDIRIPMEINGELLDKIYKDYRVWINTHQGTEIAFLKAMVHKAPLFEEDASSQIRAEIKKASRQMSPQAKPDPLFNAGLFLHMAQEYDLQVERLSRDLMDIDTLEADFMKALKGEEDDIHTTSIKPTAIETQDPGRYMTAERMAAWASLMLNDPQDSGLFITTSRVAVEHVVDIFPETKRMIRYDTIPLGDVNAEALGSWRSEFMRSIETLATRTLSDGADDMKIPADVSESETSVFLTLYVIPDTTPPEVFKSFVDTEALRDESIKTSARFKNTLIVLTEKR